MEINFILGKQRLDLVYYSLVLTPYMLKIKGRTQTTEVKKNKAFERVLVGM